MFLYLAPKKMWI